MQYREIKKFEDRLLFCLENYPITRDSDTWLMVTVWRLWFPQFLFPTGKQNEFGKPEYAVNLSDLQHLPNQDSVKRVRAVIQNKKKLFLPTTWAVAKGRGIAEDEWRTALGYPTVATTGTGAPSYTPPSEEKAKENESKLF